jgi:uncharacterized membrane protein
MEMFYLIVLRFLHVVASVCWAGGGFITYLFIEPTAKSLAPMGIQFLQHMAGKRRFNMFMVINSTLTVLSGALLLWHSTNGNLGTYMSTGPGLGFALGSLTGVAVYFVGMFGVGMRVGKMSKLGEEIQKAGGPPTPAQAAELEKLDKEVSMYSKIDFWLVALSLTLMATARYWLF